MDTTELLQSLRNYIRDCRLLRRDFQQALEYWEFKNNRGKISLAVDFSEIYEFILPDAEGEHFSLFGSTGERSAALFDRAILRQLFEVADSTVLGTDGHLILMAPYALEFDGFLYWLKASEFSVQAKAALELFEQAHRIQKSEEFNQIKTLMTEVNRRKEDLDQEEQRQVLLFLERHAPSIFAFTEDSYRNPLITARKLLSSGVLVAGDITDDTDDVQDNSVFARWYKALIRGRGEELHIQAGNDAMAMALLAQANDELRPHNRRLYLVTRSNTMHRIFEEEYENDLWSDYGYVLLHPRVFSILFSVAHKTPDEAYSELSRRCRDIESFLTITDMDNDYGAPERYEDAFVRDLRRDILRNWRATESLAISLAETAAHPSDRNVPTQSALSRMIYALEDRNLLVQLVGERLDRLASGLGNEHDILSLYHRSQGTRERHVLRSLQLETTREYKADAPEVPYTIRVLSTVSHTMPYKLHFYTPEAAGVITALTRDNSWSEAYRVLSRSWNTEKEYELPLLVAYVLGVLNRWQLARMYAERALEVASRLKTVARHEALFFYAIALRKNDKADVIPLEDHIASLRNLERAIEAKRQWLGDKQYSDPRYLKELGTQILRLNVYFNNDYPGPEEGLKYLADALSVCDDAQLRIQILNSRVFYQLESDIPFDPQSLRVEWENLEKLQKEMEPDESKWSYAVLDTLAWGEWKLSHEPLSHSRFETISRRFDLALKSRDISPEDRRLIREHLKAFEKRRKSLRETGRRPGTI